MIHLQAGQLVGKYRVVRQAGQGELFEALHDETGERVAIQVVAPGGAEAFLAGAGAAGGVEHPGIVKIIGSDRLPDGTPVLVMGPFGGVLLSERRRRQRRMEESEVLRLFQQVAAVLASVHERGLAHGSLGPESVALVADQAVPGGERIRLLGLGGGGDRKADVGALGAMIYEALAGGLTRSGRGPTPLRQLAPLVSADFERLVHRMLDPDPGKRPAMGEVAATLGRLARAGGAPSTGSLFVPALLVAGLSGVGVALLLVVVLGLLRGPVRRQVTAGDPRAQVQARLPAAVPVPGVAPRAGPEAEKRPPLIVQPEGPKAPPPIVQPIVKQDDPAPAAPGRKAGKGIRATKRARSKRSRPNPEPSE